MVNNIVSDRKTVFDTHGYKGTIKSLIKQTQDLYLSDEIPWVLGYSGGKDSTATLQLVWQAITALPVEKRVKRVHVISTDTLVENPIVALWVGRSLTQMAQASEEQCLPIQPHRLVPEVQDRFWVNLIGKGYAAPRPKFRWCTSRLKIAPSNKFITSVVKANGEAILVLGTREVESSSRAANMRKFKKNSTRGLLSRNRELDRVWVYTPIADWHDDDVWQYLMQEKNPWGFKNEELLNMYQGATSDGECPLVVDTSTPSCGDSRFGCYVCTMVGEDKSMAAMIQNDEEKEWMLPLLELRNKWLDITDPDTDKKNVKIDAERKHRDFRRMNGTLTVHNNRLVHGPYKQEYRAQLLEAVLKAEIIARNLGPEEVKRLQLITLEELEEIRRIWVMEKHELEDKLPRIYENVRGEPYPGKHFEESQFFKEDDMLVLKNICEEQGVDNEGLHYELVRNLLHVEYQHRTMVRRSKLFGALDKTFDRFVFKSEDEALGFAQTRERTRESIRNREKTTILFEDAMNLPVSMTQ